MHKYIYTKFYNDILKEASLKEIKDYNLKPIGGGVLWWITPLVSALASKATQDKPKIGFPTSPQFEQADQFQMPDVYGQPSDSPNNGGLSSNLMGDYSSQPRYGPQDNANPWQGQLMSQLFQQQTDTSRSPSEPTKTGGGGK